MEQDQWKHEQEVSRLKQQDDANELQQNGIDASRLEPAGTPERAPTAEAGAEKAASLVELAGKDEHQDTAMLKQRPAEANGFEQKQHDLDAMHFPSAEHRALTLAESQVPWVCTLS